MRVLLLCVIGLSAMGARGGEIYKWTDAQGRVHYSHLPPEGAAAQVVPIQPAPENSQPAAVQREADPRRQPDGPSGERAAAAPPQAPAVRLAPPPENQTSEYMRTLSTMVSHDIKQNPPTHQFSIKVRVRADVPVGAVLVAAFEDPGKTGRFLHATSRVVMTTSYPQKIQDDILLLSPAFTEVHCRNYTVVIRLYRDEGSDTPMGTHRQEIQSRIDWTLLRGGHICR